MQLLPDAGLLPVAQPPPAGRPAAAAELGGQHPPGAAGPQDEDDAGQRDAVRHAGSAALGLGRLYGKEGFDRLPEVVGDQRLVLHGPDDAMPAGYCNVLLVPSTRSSKQVIHARGLRWRHPPVVRNVGVAGVPPLQQEHQFILFPRVQRREGRECPIS